MVLQTVATEQFSIYSRHTAVHMQPMVPLRQEQQPCLPAVLRIVRYQQTGQYDGATMMIKRGGNDSNAVNILLPDWIC